MTDPDQRADDIADLKAQARLDRRRARDLFNHPDPQDPDHPDGDDDE